MESAVLYVTREDWTRVQAGVPGGGGTIRIAQGAAARRWPAALARARSQQPPTRSTFCRASSRAPPTTARAGSDGGRSRCWPAVYCLRTWRRRRSSIHQANHEVKSLDGQISQIFAQVMPSEKMLDPRRQMQSRLDRIRHSGAGPEYFLHTLEVLGGALAETPKTRIDSLSYREQALDMKRDRTQPRRAFTALPTGRQAGFDGRHPIVPAGRGRRRGASAVHSVGAKERP